jgi:hypothetical protein
MLQFMLNMVRERLHPLSACASHANTDAVWIILARSADRRIPAPEMQANTQGTQSWELSSVAVDTSRPDKIRRISQTKEAVAYLGLMGFPDAPLACVIPGRSYHFVIAMWRAKELEMS